MPMTAEQENRLRCRTIAAQQAEIFDALAANNKPVMASLSLLRIALQQALLKDFDAEVATLIIQDDRAGTPPAEIKTALLATFD